LNSTGEASGDIYIDDGISITPNATRQVTLTISDNMLSVSTTGNYFVNQSLGNVTILGVGKPENVSFSRGTIEWSWINNNLIVTGFDDTSAWNSPWTLSWQ
jgi:alpha-glucosidase